MKRRLVVIKFGGSIITDKKRPFTARPSIIASLASTIAEVRSTTDADFLIGNGAGSFGHFPAHEYGLRDGAQTQRQWYGAASTHNAVQKLNTLVANALLADDVPAFSLAPSSFLYCTDKAVTASNTEPLKQLLAHRVVPVVYGDTIIDAVRGITILSTETVLLACMQALRGAFDTMRVVYIFGAPGVLDKQGAVMSELSSDMPVVPYTGHAHDVTGGIVGKVEAARAAAKVADDVRLVGSDPTAIAAAIAGQPAGTRILA
jgi:isopentenyl phosphate kinase